MAVMDFYNTIASWTGWPAVVALMLLAGGYAYWVMQRRTEIIKEKNEWLKDQLTALKECAPDILAKRCADRWRLAKEELERLNSDHEASQESIQAKEAELAEVKSQIANLMDQLTKAHDSLKIVVEGGLVCPECGAPLETRGRHPEFAEYQGFHMVVDHDLTKYECGLEIVDGKVTSKCKSCDSNRLD